MADLSDDQDVKALFNSPTFLKKIVNSFDPQTRAAYEIDLERKTRERIETENQNRRNFQNLRRLEATIGKYICITICAIYVALVFSVVCVYVLNDYVSFPQIWMDVDGVDVVTFIASRSVKSLFQLCIALIIPFIVPLLLTFLATI